ncbi:glycosyltransferase family 4 protein [Microbacterium sp. zg.Y625]|uniref:glycosyltransferase family 4 protein n=1 Tax=Microbacterium jiangjiandongii TaxID=3049071 RepID=UPI00214B7774|nr:MULTISPECIES: glycosyltransferase family 4 protein [unclassified Microbacterium]MCR2793741.1 glycosyltransferase family 4 protein [Microbacterium sp. zg.Y625]WIM26086.1 glycosyltransferase family 4 protein [Microbacterium sp. zg-Y625]
MLEGVAQGVSAVADVLRKGVRTSLLDRRAARMAAVQEGATFASGVTTTFTPSRAEAWYRLERRPLVIALLGDDAAGDVAAWVMRAQSVLNAELFVGERLAPRLGHLHRAHVASSTPAVAELAALWEWTHRQWRRHDLLLLDASQPLPDPVAVIHLQHAAHEYHHDHDIGIVVPAYDCDGVQVSGYDVERPSGAVVPSSGGRDYGQHRIPRYVLTAAMHGMYVTADALDRVDLAERHLAGLSLDEQAGRVVRQAWAGHIRTLCLASTAFAVTRIPQLDLGAEQRRWQLERRITAADGRPRIVFVLNATSISGGIRVVFEQANGLAERGFDVEIWSLEPEPGWFDLRVPVQRYRTYEDLLLALRRVDALKVATWWETGEIVWLASVSHGVPVFLVQEFETWFYPDDPVARAAVVAGYRREFFTVTQASYQQQELAEVGVAARLLPIGYDDRVFRPLPGIEREPDTVLALGRSFFQKNFEMTRRAWQRLGEARPTLVLFGNEPDLMRDERARYVVRPDDAEVNELYNRATLFVQTSRHEGFGLPVLEAMAAGCPVITTDSHGNRDFCHDGSNCIIVPQDDDAALAAAMRRLLDDPAERERLRVAGWETARRHAWRVVLDETAGFYREVQAASAPT